MKNDSKSVEVIALLVHLVSGRFTGMIDMKNFIKENGKRDE